uniref:Uncharacterized protein n=1 Tax=Myoviridae sp. ctcPl3 TaxID=2826669 RepID=A0A8S5QXE1_9CAUD|nr:MAG TPA: Protein of unknown function (DUF983) [Myoviridae sp. ctcPl3]
MKLHATELVVNTHCSKCLFKFYGNSLLACFAKQTISFL